MNANPFPRSSRDRRNAQAMPVLPGGVRHSRFAGVTPCAPRASEGPVAFCCDRDHEYAGSVVDARECHRHGRVRTHHLPFPQKTTSRIAGREEIPCFFPVHRVRGGRCERFDTEIRRYPQPALSRLPVVQASSFKTFTRLDSRLFHPPPPMRCTESHGRSTARRASSETQQEGGDHLIRRLNRYRLRSDQCPSISTR